MIYMQVGKRIKWWKLMRNLIAKHEDGVKNGENSCRTEGEDKKHS